jgi:nucleoside-diphosphate-sugar epimerase
MNKIGFKGDRFMGNKAIVTGGTGFVGSNLCRKLVDQKWQVFVISRKSSDYTNIEDIKDKVSIYEYDENINHLIDFFNTADADVVFHMASLFIAEHKVEEVDDLLNSNVKFGLHVLEAMKETNTKLIINTGTSWQHYHSDDYNPVNLYAATKEVFENLMKYYIEAEKIRGITLKLFDTYSETDRRPKLINLLNTFADEHKELEMTQGEQVIDLVHVDDVTNAFIKAFEYLMENNEMKHEIFGVGTGNVISLRDLVTIFEQATGKKLNIIWGGRNYRKREVMELWTHYKTLPNWESVITLREGLMRYLSR